jgi:hypothetical protein
MRTTKEQRLNQAIARFLKELGVDWDHKTDPGAVALSRPDRVVLGLVEAAFKMYELTWANMGGWDIRDWKWPADTLKEGGAEFYKSDEPWTVLLRRACEFRGRIVDQDIHVRRMYGIGLTAGRSI